MARNREKVVVKFLKECDKYNPTEIAGFSPGVSASLIKRGVAELYIPETPQQIADMARAKAEEAQAVADKAAKDADATAAVAKQEERLAKAATAEEKKNAEALSDKKQSEADAANKAAGKGGK